MRVNIFIKYSQNLKVDQNLYSKVLILKNFQ